MTANAAQGPRLVRLVVPSPDGSRVLARPNGLAGWRLPAVSLEGERSEAATWTERDRARAAAVAGGPVEPVKHLADDAWEWRSTGRIRAAGTTWIAVEDADRLGADAVVVRAWAAISPEKPRNV